MYLLDSNILLELLLEQNRKEDCRCFLAQHPNQLHVTDFTLHSIGVILFRQKCESVFSAFAQDIFTMASVVLLPSRFYPELAELRRKFGLDFDDAYQLGVARALGLRIVTMDKDFLRPSAAGHDVHFL